MEDVAELQFLGELLELERLDAEEHVEVRVHRDGGVAQVVNGDREFEIRANESTFIPAGHRHRLSNRGSEPLVIIEVQTGSYVEEDDIVRLEDRYARIDHITSQALLTA